MPANQPRLLSCLMIGVAAILSACEPREDSADVPRTDTATATYGTDTATSDTASLAVNNPPPNAVVCGAADSLEVSAGNARTLSLPPQTHGHELRVHANSLPPGQQVKITMRDLRQPYAGVDVTARPPVTFVQPVTLRLSYRGCTAPDTMNLRIYKRTGAQWDSVPGSVLDTANHVVRVDLTTFSQYALGAG